VPLAAAAGAAIEAAAGAGAALARAPSPFGLSLSKPCPSCGVVEDKAGLRQAQPEREREQEPAKGADAHTRTRARWTRTLAAYRRAEARVASFKAAEALLPVARRGFPASNALEEEFGRLDSLRLAALRRLFRLPAPNVAALALKLRLAVANQAWELSGCERCLAAMAEDARRLSANAPG
jgi:hypothetical protein